MKNILFVVMLLSLVSATRCRAANYEMPLGKIDAFLSLPTGDMREWARANGTIIQEESCWNPRHRTFAVYECNNVRLWFQIRASDQEKYVGRLEVIAESAAIKGKCLHNPIYAFTFPEGACLPAGEVNIPGTLLAEKQERDNNLGSLDQLIAKQQHMIQAMAGTYSDVNRAYRDLRQLQGMDEEMIQQFKKLVGNKKLGEQAQRFQEQYFGKDPSTQDGMPSDNTSDLAGKGKDGQEAGNGESSKSGMKGPFPIAYPLSKWLVTVLDIVSEYLQIQEISMQVLAAAYLIAPEAFNFIGNYVGKLEQLVVPKSIGEFLDNVADVVQYAKQFYNYAKGIQGLLSDQSFQTFARNLDLGKAMKLAEPVIPKDVLRKINQYFPVTELMNGKLNLEQWKEISQNLAWKEIQNRACDIPRLCQFVDMPGLLNCREAGDMSECGQNWLLQQTKDNIKGQLPADFQRFGGAVDDLLNGKPAEAAKEALAIEMAKRTGITIDQATDLYRQAKEGNWERFVLQAANYKVAAFHQCKELMEAVKQRVATTDQAKEAAKCFLRATGNDKLAGYIDRLNDLEKITLTNIKTTVKRELGHLQFTQREIDELLRGNAAYLAEKMAEAAGFTHPEAKAALLKGSPTRALEIQMQKSWELDKTRHYQQQGIYLQQKLKARGELMLEFLDKIKSGTLPLPDSPRKFGRFLSIYLRQV